MRSLVRGVSVPGGGGSAPGAGAPADAEYIVGAAHGDLSAERVATDTATVAWDFGTAAQAKANVPDDAITYAKIQNVSATDRLLGRDTAAAGNIEELTATGGIEFTGTGIQTSAFTGDVTKAAGATATTIANDAVTYAKMQDVSATDRLLGRDTAGAGNVEELTATGGLEFTGTGIQTSAFTGDVTKAAGGTATTIANDAVTYAKMQDVSATDRLLGRVTAAAGNVEEIVFTDLAQTLLDDATQAAMQATIGVVPVSVPISFGNGLGAGYAVVDNTNHYMAFCANPGVTAATAANGLNSVNQRRAGTITDVYFAILVGGTNGSGETGSLIIRVNNTTDNTIVNNTVVWNTGVTFTEYNTTGLSLALAAGDFWQVKIDPPTFATNPTAVFYFCQVTVTYP